ncbi:TAXI family TRAP transporter solute-binding subunit [Pseudalkalibacillus sp. R45]|uniref:TAXI family TRAP transporter solute-binding subunit n=1 Tax=Pseudalkalibacillus sp. R45 TaxID=3457433 RepID=UPI003FCCCBCD
MFRKIKIEMLILFAALLLLGGCSALPNNQVDSSKKSNPTAEAKEKSNIEGSPVQLKIATLSQGSSWYVYGATMAELLRKHLPAGSVIDVLPYSGGIGNIKLVANKQAGLGLTFSVNNKWGYDGNVAYDKKFTNLRALAGGFDQYYVGIVWRNEFAEKYGLKSIKDLKEKKVPVKLMTVNVGSQGEFAARQILEANGLSYDYIKTNGGSVTHTTFDVVQTALKDGQADMFIQVMTKGHPAFTEIALTTPVTFVSLEDNVIEKLKAYGNEAAMLEAGVFKGQDKPVKTIGFPTTLIVSDDFPDETAYQITKILAENKDDLAAGHKALEAFKPEEAWKPERLGIPLHPGAKKYYKEKSWLK